MLLSVLCAVDAQHPPNAIAHVRQITGVGYTIFDEWFHQDEIGEFLIRLHTLKMFGLDEIYPVLNGVALIGLLVTGLSMTSLFKKRPQPKSVSDR